MKLVCKQSGEDFEISAKEMRLREKFGFLKPPTTAPWIRLQELGAFWPHFVLHRRKCDHSGKNIVSPFSEHCPYPVYHRAAWLEHAEPPGAEFNFDAPFFSQLWDVFSRSAIRHNSGTGNENCEYTDDWWYSKNCYLCHSGINCEDLRYSFRVYGGKSSQFQVFSFDSELCVDVVNCHRCFNLVYSLNCRECYDSAFLYDCRNCSNCLFCSNLRNKQYCIDNKQLSKDAFEKERAKLELSSRINYESAKARFHTMLRSSAVHRALFLDQCHECTGNYLEQSKNCENCYFVLDGEDSVNCVRGGPKLKDGLDSIGFAIDTELLFNTALVIDRCYDIRNCFHILQSRFIEYCGFLERCEHCFACLGLVGKKFHILNKPYSEEDYFKEKEKIVRHLQETGVYGQFFPGYFAPHAYEESWSGFYFPLSDKEILRRDFRPQEYSERKAENQLLSSDVPDTPSNPNSDITNQVFWDEKAQRPFKIADVDINFSKKLGIPLPNCYYAERLKDNFRQSPFNGRLRNTNCGKSGKAIKTSWPAEFDGQIYSEECYLQVVR